MVKTLFDNLPTKEELEVPEILLGSHLLMQASTYMGKYCDDLCKDFMLCKYELHDPKRCLEEGRKVTACGMEFMNKVKNTCRGELEALTTCVKYTSPILTAEKCREQQAIFDACMYRKMGMDKPPMGYFALTRLHETDRPRVPEWVPDFPQPAGNIPADKIQKRTRPVTGAPRGYFADP